MRLRMALMSLAFTTLLAGTGFANIDVSSDGSDGALNITADTTIDLGQAVTGKWNDASTIAGKGIYDPEKWAVVFKYSSVTIAPGATLKFTNHYANPPVVWLVKGDVTINGTVNLDGTGPQRDPMDYGTILAYGLPGPGGFRPGIIPLNGENGSSGFGPGGSINGIGIYSSGPTSLIYGNSRIIPLIGGSGGCMVYEHTEFFALGGGGAILIAANGSIILNGKLSSFGSSGGGIRLLANALSGTNGNLSAEGGRIAIEAATCDLSGITCVPGPVQTAISNPVQLWPADSDPCVRIVSIGGRTAPADPKSQLTNADADIIFQNDKHEPLKVLVEAKNVPTSATVTVLRVPTVPATSGNRDEIPAGFVGGNASLSTWEASIPGDEQLSTLQVRADWNK